MKKKIAFIAPQGQIVQGGLERYVQKLAQLLIAEGHDLTVFTINSHQEKKYIDQTIEGVHYKRLPVLFDLSQRFKIWPSLFNELRNGSFEIIHCFLHSQTPFFISWAAAKLTKAKFFVTVYGPPQNEANYPFLQRFFLSSLDLIAQPVIRNSDMIFCRGIPTSQKYVKDIKVPKNHIVNSISALSQRYLTEVSKTKKRIPYTILFNGRLHPHKGPQDIIKAVSFLTNKYPNIKLWLVGPDHKYRLYLNSLIESLNLQSNIRFYGVVPEDQLMELMDKASCFVISSVFEGLSQAMLKAIARKIPIISTAIPSSVSMLENGKHGLLYPFGDIEMLSSHIDKVFSNQKHYELLTQKLSKSLNKFVYEKELPTLIKYYSN